MNEEKTNPYVGTRPFQESERDRFFGRDREIRELQALAISERIVLFYAQSGAGKSSLINTYLIPNLRERGYDVFPVGRVGGDAPSNIRVENIYVFNLIRILAPKDADLTTLTKLSLSDFFKTLSKEAVEAPEPEELEPAYRKQILIIDQFEELFSTHQAEWEKREDFFVQLAQALQDLPHLSVLLAMREDYIALLDPYVHLFPSRLRIRYYMQQLEQDAALKAVKEPVKGKDFSRPYEAGAAEKLVDDLRTIKVMKPDGTSDVGVGQFVEPLYLQVICYELWNNLPAGGTTITMKNVQDVGDVSTSLGNYYARRVQAVAQAEGVHEGKIRKWFSEELISPTGIRNMVLQEPGETSANLENRVIRALSDLVRPEPRAGAVFYELTHDRLVEPILANNKKWEEENSSPLQRQADLWNQKGRDESWLLTDQALADMEEWASSHGDRLSLIDREFLEASRALKKRIETTRRNRMIAWIATGFAIVVLAILSFLAVQASNEAMVQQKIAEAKAKEANENAIIAEQNRQIAQENEEKAFTAIQAAETAQSIAEAQRSAARAQIYQTRPGGLYTSTLLAIDSMQSIPSDEAEEILRKNISLLPLPVAQASQAGKINSLAFSPMEGSNIFATASADGTTCAWKVEDGKMLLLFCPPPSDRPGVSVVAFSPDGSFIVTGDQAGLVQILDSQTGNILHAYQRVKSPSNIVQIVDVKDGSLQGEYTPLEIPVRGVSVRPPSGSQIAVAYYDGEIPVFSPDTGKISAPLRVGSIPQVTAFSPDGGLLAVGSENGTVTVYDLRALRIISGARHQGGVLAIAFSPNSRSMATGGKDNTASITDIQTGKELLRLPTENWVRDIAYSPDSSWLVTVSDDHRIRVWDTLTGRERLVMLQEGVVTDVTISSNSRWIATTGEDRTVRVWNSETGAEVFQIPLNASGSVLAFSQDSKYLVSTDESGAVNIWDISVMATPAESIQFNGVVENVQYSLSGEQLAASEGNVVWLLNSQRLSDLSERIQGSPTLEFTSNVEKMIFSPDSRFLGILTEGNDVAFYNIQSRRVQKPIVSNLMKSIAFSPNSQQFIASDLFGNIQAWNVLNGEVIGNPDEKYPQGFSLVSSSAFLAIGTKDIINIMSVNGDGEFSQIDSSGDNALLVFNNDGSLLASADSSGKIGIWKYQNDEFAIVNSFFKDQATALAFNPLGTLLAVGTAQDVFLMDVASGEEIARIPHPDKVNGVSFSANGETLVTASSRIVQFWDIAHIPQIRRDDVVPTACSRLTENFDLTQWSSLFGDQKYRSLCENLPVP